MQTKSSISIDGWTIDASSYRIARDGVEIKLQPRSMDLLLYLAEHPDQVVSREEIEENVWQGRVVGYDSVSSSIAKIRKAFGDTSKNPRVIETIPKAGYRLIAPVLMETIDLESFADEPREGQFERKLTVIFYADVAGYSRLTGEDEDRTHRQLRQNMKTISGTITSFQGRIIHYAGDAVLADFPTASTALNCALEVQQHIARISSHLPENQRVLFRIGVNLGEVIVDGDEIYGDGVNVAARLESLAEPGGVCISSAVFDAIGQKQNFEFEYRGEKTVKNIQQPVRVYAVHLVSGGNVPIAEPDPPLRPSSRSLRDFKISPALMIGVLVVVVGLLTGGFIAFFPVSTEVIESPVTSEKNFAAGSLSLAILPFKNTSNYPGQGIFADGLTDDLITDLSNINGLQVTPRHSSYQFKATKVPLLDIARELQVRYIVQGSVRQSFENIRVNVQLVDTKSNQEIWAHRFDDNIENIFKLQDQIISKILNKLNLDTGQKMVSKRSTANIEAYDYFLRAEHRRLNARGSKSGFKILEFYRRAIELDPLYVAAYTGLAREALTNWQLGDSEVMPASAWKKLVYESAGKALELDSKNTDALGIIGLLQAISGEHDAGIASVKSAVAINPSNPQLHADLAAVLSYGGSHDAALQSINAAIDRHATPPSAYLDERSRIYFFLGQFEKALIDAESDQNIRDIINFSVFIHGALNNRELAQRFVGVRLQARPWENQASYRVLFAYYRRLEDIELIVDSAARAGMPRFAYGFDPGASIALDNGAISKLTSAGPWQGNTHDGSEFYQQFAAGNDVSVRTADSTMSGAYHIENNKLCIAPQSVLLDLADCGYIYPVGADNSYTWVTLDGVYRFSVE